MELKLSCFKCGSTDFEITEVDNIKIEGHSYLLHEDYKNTQLICSKCGLEDYVENLVITFR